MSEARLVLSRPETATLEIDGREYAVRIGADLDVDVQAEILRLSQEFRRFGNKADRMPDWINRCKRLLVEVVEEQHPSEEDLDYFRGRGLGASEIVQLLAFLSGNVRGAEAEVAETLSEGLPESAKNGGTADPTTSPRRSRTRSSRSARRSTSAPDTGEGSDGATSGSTSRASTAA